MSGRVRSVISINTPAHGPIPGRGIPVEVVPREAAVWHAREFTGEVAEYLQVVDDDGPGHGYEGAKAVHGPVGRQLAEGERPLAPDADGEVLLGAEADVVGHVAGVGLAALGEEGDGRLAVLAARAPARDRAGLGLVLGVVELPRRGCGCRVCVCVYVCSSIHPSIHLPTDQLTSREGHEGRAYQHERREEAHPGGEGLGRSIRRGARLGSIRRELLLGRFDRAVPAGGWVSMYVCERA